MAALVKTNADLATGGLAVLRRSYDARDGVLGYDIEYVCLPQFANRYTQYFQKGARPFSALPSSANGLQIREAPLLYEFSAKTENGLTYFKARYAGPIPILGTTEPNESRGYTETESNDIKNVTWTTTEAVGFTQTVPGTTTGATQFVQTGTQTITNSADYVSTTITYTGVGDLDTLPEPQGRVSPLFNQKTSGGSSSAVQTAVNSASQGNGSTFNASAGGGSGGGGATGVRFIKMLTQSRTRDARGIVTVTKSSTGLYVT